MHVRPSEFHCAFTPLRTYSRLFNVYDALTNERRRALTPPGPPVPPISMPNMPRMGIDSLPDIFIPFDGEFLHVFFPPFPGILWMNPGYAM
jgi:hypothetical protein